MFRFPGRMTAWAFVLLLSAAPVPAQNRSATISGLVKDATGGVLPGATVTVRAVARNQARHTVSDERGRYAFPNQDIGLNEVVTLCAALGVAPLHMIVPWDDDWMVALGARGLERKDAAPKAMEPAHVVRDWFVGKRALRVTDDTRLYHYMQKPPQAVVDNAKARKKERKS